MSWGFVFFPFGLQWLLHNDSNKNKPFDFNCHKVMPLVHTHVHTHSQSFHSFFGCALRPPPWNSTKTIPNTNGLVRCWYGLFQKSKIFWYIKAPRTLGMLKFIDLTTHLKCSSCISIPKRYLNPEVQSLRSPIASQRPRCWPSHTAGSLSSPLHLQRSRWYRWKSLMCCVGACSKRLTVSSFFFFERYICCHTEEVHLVSCSVWHDLFCKFVHLGLDLK